MPERITYIVANVDRAVHFEWVASLLDPVAFELNFVLLNPGPSRLEAELKARGILCERVTYCGYLDLPTALLRVFWILRRIRPQAVHTHILPANMVGLPAAWLVRTPMRVYTRHHSTSHHDYSPSWVAVDRAINGLATHIVAISENVREVLLHRERVSPTKIRLIHHGFLLRDFDKTTDASVEILRKKWEIGSRAPVVGVIARYEKLKGVQHIVEAARVVLRAYPEAIFLFANAGGDPEIQAAVRSLPLENHREIPFEPDLFALYRLFDVYVHTPIDPHIEAFGQTYVEALIAGIPSVFSLSGVAKEFIRHEHNALVVPYASPGRTAEAILRLLSDPILARGLTEQGRRDVETRFRAEDMVLSLESLYKER